LDSAQLSEVIAHYFIAYYREARRQLSGRTFGTATMPSHLLPGKKLVRVWETADGHFVVEHISRPSDASYLGQEAIRSHRYEDYLQVLPRLDETLEERTGMQVAENAAVLDTRLHGKTLGDAGYEEVAHGDYVERVDVITRSKVPELTEEKAREAAHGDLQPYI
jgi:hypothetical protein